MRHDVYRFVVERPVQAREPDDFNLIVTRGWRPGPRGTPFHAALRAAVVSASHGDLRSAALAHVKSPRFRGTLESAGPILRGLETFLLRKPRPDFGEAVTAIVSAANGTSPEDLVADIEFNNLRDEITDSLLALVALRSELEAGKADGHRMMQLVGLVEWMARHSDDREKPPAAAVARAADSVVLLPPDLFPLPFETRVSSSSRMRAVEPGGVDATRIAGRDMAAAAAVREVIGAAARPSADGLLGDQHWSGLSDGTRSLLSHLGVGPGTALVGAVEALERADLASLPDVGGARSGTLPGTGASDPLAPTSAGLVMQPGVIPSLVPWATAKPGTQSAPATVAVGVADLYAVRRAKVEYEYGELAHVENVMGTESRKRKHRFETETEVETETTEETETETTRDLATSETNELDTEIASESSTSVDVNANMGLEYSYGDTLTVTAGFGVQASMATSNSQRLATHSARETTERTATRLRTKVTERRKSRTRTSSVETNQHGFENPGPGHVVGMYRWLDKVETLDLYAYGRRLLLEFNIPEPAAFWRYQDAINASGRLPPAPPPFEYLGRPIDASTVTPWSYRALSARFEAQGLEPPPPGLVSVGGAWSAESQDQKEARSFYVSVKDTIAVPAGYRAVSLRAHLHQSSWLQLREVEQPAGDAEMVVNSGGPTEGRLSVGDLVEGVPVGKSMSYTGTFTSVIMGNVPIALLAQGTTGWALGMEIFCAITEEGYNTWQLRTFDRLLGAWRSLQTEWAAAVQRLMSRQGVVIEGRNPGEGMQIVRNELRRWILELMTRRDSLGNSGMGVPDPMESWPPDLDPARAAEMGRMISFVEQAFEWNLMSWRFHPYFWATPDRWTHLLAETDPDPAFQAFLRAGSARTAVPVRRGWEKQVGYFLATGQVWGGGGAPQVDQSLFLSIAGEAAEPDTAVKVDQPSWQVRIPTSLVALDGAGITMPTITYSE